MRSLDNENVFMCEYLSIAVLSVRAGSASVCVKLSLSDSLRMALEVFSKGMFI